MNRGHISERARLRAPFVILALFFAICALSGGASRADSFGQVIVRIASVLFIAYSLARPSQRNPAVRWPLAMLGVLAAMIAVQLVPLPPALWTRLPGREPFLQAAVIANAPQPWRPISLTPGNTLNALLALMPPAAVLLGWSRLNRPESRRMVFGVLAAALASAMLGLVQMSAAGDGFYLYSVTNEGQPVGLFANRNHQAIFLASTFPMLAVAVRLMFVDRRSWSLVVLAVGLGFLFLVLILVAGSRAGIFFAFVALALTPYVLSLSGADIARALQSTRSRVIATAVLISIAAALAVTILSPQAKTIGRVAGDGTEELRITRLPETLGLARSYFPVGAGFGSFDETYRRIETDANLSREYLNHAHNDLVEIVIAAGAGALALMLVFAFWSVRAIGATFDRKGKADSDVMLTRLGATIIAVLGVASAFDYPLRVPMLMSVFALACCWLADADGRTGRG